MRATARRLAQGAVGILHAARCGKRHIAARVDVFDLSVGIQPHADNALVARVGNGQVPVHHDLSVVGHGSVSSITSAIGSGAFSTISIISLISCGASAGRGSGIWSRSLGLSEFAQVSRRLSLQYQPRL